MATETSGPRKGGRWLRWLGIAAGVFVLLLVVGYFVATSSWFLKSIILPRASDSLNAQITVEDASISPFSAVSLRNLRVQTTGTDPLLTAQEVHARYSLTDIMKGNLKISEVRLESPVVNVVTFPDGSSNLDPLTKETEKKEPRDREAKEKKEEKPPRLDLGKLALNNATVRKTTQREDGSRELIELSGVNISAENLGNDQSGKLALSAALRMDEGRSTSSNGVLAATIAGNFDLALDAALKPKTVQGQTRVDVSEARGSFAPAAGLNVTLNANLTPTQLNDVSLRFAQAGRNLGALAVSGPFHADTMEGQLAVNVSQIDRQLLNLAGAGMGVDFNQTTINSTNTIELSQRGRVVTVDGALLVGNFSATQQGQTTPTLDVRSAYAVTYDQTNRTAMIRNLELAGTQNNAEFLRGTLARPMLLDLGNASGAVDESAFNLVITNFNLPDWHAFIGTNATIASGRLGLTLNLLSRQSGKSLALDLATRLSGLSAVVGSNRIDNADLTFTARGTVQDFSAVKFDEYRAELARSGRPALAATGALQYNTRTQDADVQANLDASLTELMSLAAVEGMQFTAGSIKFAGRVTQKNTTPQQTNNPVLDRTVVGNLALNELTGAMGSNRFDRLAAVIDLDVAMQGAALEIRKASGTLQQSGQAGGTFEAGGGYHLENKTGTITAKVTDLNQHVLKSFAAALGDKQLETVTINATTSAKLTGPTDWDVQAALKVANLVVNDPSGAVPRTPLAVDATAEAAMVKQVMDLRKADLALTRTERAPNSISMSGRFDLAKSNAWTGNLKVNSEGLDVTPYYEIFAGKPSTNVAAAKPTAPATAPAPKETPAPGEPEPVTLPFTQFLAEMNIAKFFLREIAISNLVTKTSIDHGRINVNPFSLILNGAPVNLTALLNLGVAGYQYDVNATLDHVPVEPLANTFAPEKKGQFNGTLISKAQITGAGITGLSVQKNLQGQVGLTLTNANIQVLNSPRLQKILVPISVALRVPELADSPLNWVDARATVGTGQVQLAGATIEATVFRAGIGASTISIAKILTNSTLNDLPVEIALKRNVAEKARMVAAGTPADVEFIALPRFVSIGGTVGEPKPEIDKLAVGRILAGTVGNFVGGDAGRILRNLGNIGAGSSTNQTSTSTNGASSNDKVGNLIQGLGGLLQKPATTNAPGTNAPATNRSPTLPRGLDDLFRRR